MPSRSKSFRSHLHPPREPRAEPPEHSPGPACLTNGKSCFWEFQIHTSLAGSDALVGRYGFCMGGVHTCAWGCACEHTCAQECHGLHVRGTCMFTCKSVHLPVCGGRHLLAGTCVSGHVWGVHIYKAVQGWLCTGACVHACGGMFVVEEMAAGAYFTSWCFAPGPRFHGARGPGPLSSWL